jgi:hypothetical protein
MEFTGTIENGNLMRIGGSGLGQKKKKKLFPN